MRIRGYPESVPCWHELVSSDPGGSTTFYESVFGWQAKPIDETSTLFLHHDLAVAGLSPTAAPGQSSGWLTYLATDDADATADRVRSGSGTVLIPPTDIGNRGRKALFSDREGAVFAVWQHGTFAGAQVGNEPNAVCWSEVGSRDEAAAIAFYGHVFDWTERPVELGPGLEYTEWLSQGRVVAGMVAMGEQYPAEVSALWRTVVEVDDYAAVVARAHELGAQVVVPQLDVVVGQFAQFIDPQGASIGIVELIPTLRGLD